MQHSVLKLMSLILKKYYTNRTKLYLCVVHASQSFANFENIQKDNFSFPILPMFATLIVNYVQPSRFELPTSQTCQQFTLITF